MDVRRVVDVGIVVGEFVFGGVVEYWWFFVWEVVEGVVGGWWWWFEVGVEVGRLDCCCWRKGLEWWREEDYC